MSSVDAACRTRDSAHQTSGPLQVGAVDDIFCAGDEAAATVSPWMREMRRREGNVAAVNDMHAEEVSMMPSMLMDCHEQLWRARDMLALMAYHLWLKSPLHVALLVTCHRLSPEYCCQPAQHHTKLRGCFACAP